MLLSAYTNSFYAVTIAYRKGSPMTLATYIALPGTTAKAMTHWHEVFGGELEILYYRDTPLEDMGFEPDPGAVAHATLRSEEHTSELQSRFDIVCRLLLAKKNIKET